MKRYIIVIILALCLASCNQHSKHWETLIQVESLMSERPDSALVVLQGIDTTQFHSAEDKALYALLYTQAEDKNYIDALDDSKISIAVEYYKNSDDQYHNMLSYYYLACVQFNNKEYSNSITSLLHAEDEAIDLGDDFYLGLIYRQFGDTYYLHTKVDIIGKFCKLQEKKICQNTLKHNVLHIIGKS